MKRKIRFSMLVLLILSVLVIYTCKKDAPIPPTAAIEHIPMQN